MLEDHLQPNETVGSYHPRRFAAMMPDPILSKNENGVQKNKFASTLCEQVRSVGYHFSGNNPIVAIESILLRTWYQHVADVLHRSRNYAKLIQDHAIYYSLRNYKSIIHRVPRLRTN